jgi:RNA polymerase sigma-70 factor (ECF subfamily)
VDVEKREPSAGAVAEVISVEEQLLQRARAGSREAWQRLYERHHAGLLRHLIALTGSMDVAEDLCQESFAIAIRSMDRFRGESTFSTWLHGIGLNVARHHWRREKSRGRTVEHYADAQGAHDAIDDALLGGAKRRVLYGILGELPDTLREAFILKDVEGFSESEVAGALGISVGNASMRASRARAYLRNRLLELGWVRGDIR